MSLSFPFVFDATSEVALLMIIALLVLLLLRYIPVLRRTLGESIYGVNRSWFGGGLFVISILALCFLAHDNYILYSGSLLTITFADSFAAIVGAVYGKNTIQYWEVIKALRGLAPFL